MIGLRLEGNSVDERPGSIPPGFNDRTRQIERLTSGPGGRAAPRRPPTVIHDAYDAVDDGEVGRRGSNGKCIKQEERAKNLCADFSGIVELCSTDQDLFNEPDPLSHSRDVSVTDIRRRALTPLKNTLI